MKFYVQSGNVYTIQNSTNYKQAAIDFLSISNKEEIGKYIIVDVKEIDSDSSDHDSKIFFSTETLLKESCCCEMKLVFTLLMPYIVMLIHYNLV